MMVDEINDGLVLGFDKVDCQADSSNRLSAYLKDMWHGRPFKQVVRLCSDRPGQQDMLLRDDPESLFVKITDRLTVYSTPNLLVTTESVDVARAIAETYLAMRHSCTVVRSMLFELTTGDRILDEVNENQLDPLLTVRHGDSNELADFLSTVTDKMADRYDELKRTGAGCWSVNHPGDEIYLIILDLDDRLGLDSHKNDHSYAIDALASLYNRGSAASIYPVVISKASSLPGSISLESSLCAHVIVIEKDNHRLSTKIYHASSRLPMSITGEIAGIKSIEWYSKQFRVQKEIVTRYYLYQSPLLRSIR